MFNELEKKVMALLEEDSAENLQARTNPQVSLETIQNLRAQWGQASLLEREWTGCGFFTNFQLPEDVPLLDPPDFILDIATAEIAGFEAPTGFILWIKEGRLSFLEGYSYEKPDVVWDETRKVLAVSKAD